MIASPAPGTRLYRGLKVILSRGPIRLTRLLKSALLRVGWVEPRCAAAFCIPATYSLLEIDKDNRCQKPSALDSGSLWPVYLHSLPKF